MERSVFRAFSVWQKWHRNCGRFPRKSRWFLCCMAICRKHLVHSCAKAGFDVMSIDVETLAGTVWRIAAQKQDGLGIWKIHRWKHPKSSEKAWLHHKFSGEKAVNGQKQSQRLADTHKWKNCWVSWETLRLYVQFVFRDCKSFAKKCEKAVDNCHIVW